MQIGQTQLVRSEWQDRAPSIESLRGALTTGPHALTLRSGFTFIANRSFHLSAICMNIVRTAASTGTSYSAIQVQIRRAGISNVFQQTIFHSNNAAGSNSVRDIPVDMILQDNDVVNVYTFDGTTGGTNSYEWSLAGNSYDT